MLNINPLLMVDGYKLGHHNQYPEGMNYLFSNFTARGNHHFKRIAVEKYMDDNIVVFGTDAVVQYLKEVWKVNFFDRPMEEVVGEFHDVVKTFLGLEELCVEHVKALHEWGTLPIRFRSLPEGTLCPMNVPFFTIENTVLKFAWLVNYIETQVSALLWKPVTAATIARHYKAILNDYYDITGSDKSFMDFMVHDFSMRGLGGIEDAAMSGMGHLTSFSGSDNIPAIMAVNKFYKEDVRTQFLAGGVPATEHSVTSSNIQSVVKSLGVSELEAEKISISRLLNKYPTGIFSYVSDTYDYFGVLTDVLPSLKEQIMARDGKLTVRPDCYSQDTSILTPDGWKLFSELESEDLVAQVLSDGSYEFVKPLKIVDQEYQGDMHHFKDHHGKVDLLVTPNHRMVLEQSGRERIVFAENLSKRGNHEQKMFRSAKSNAATSEISDLDRLRIAFQADGSFCTGVGTSIRFSFSKQRKIDRMVLLLSTLGYDYIIYDLKSGGKEFNIKVDSTLFKKDFSWVNPLSRSSLWSVGFLSELAHWDSSVRNEGRFKFDTTNEEVINVVELVAISAGYGCLISKSEDSREEHFSDVFTAHIMADNRAGGRSWTKDVVNYEGRVYCVTVPSGKVLVKRNRCTLVSGNSGDPTEIICGEAREVTQSELDNMSGISIGDRVCVSLGETKLYFEACPINSDEGYSVGAMLVEIKPTNEDKGTLELLWDTFGGTYNEKGYRVLDSHIGIIYGDSITPRKMNEILERMEKMGFAASNVVFGAGSFTYQYITRDTFGMAMKATYCEVNGQAVQLYKDPKTGDGGKKSAKGMFIVQEDDEGKLKLFDGMDKIDYLRAGYCKLDTGLAGTVQLPFQTIRARINGTLEEWKKK